MPYLIQVRDLDGDLMPGYGTLNVIGLALRQSGLLYHRLFSSYAPDLVSEPAEMQQPLTALKEHRTVTWLLDSGFDDSAVLRTIWEQQEHGVWRLSYPDRRVAFQEWQGQWQEGDIAQIRAELRPLARVETSLEVKRGKQVRPKKQPLRLNRLHKCAPQDPGSARGAGRVALRGTRAGNRDYCSPIDR
jgi:hypothetical protein